MAHATVADLTIDEFKSLVREVVTETFVEMFSDPDEGLELRDDFKMEIQDSLATVAAGRG